MVKIPCIKIPSVRVGSIVPTSNIGTGGATPAPPTPITYLTQWKIVGNSEVQTLPYPDGIVLPTGYKRCEYLESDGTAYIEVPFGFYKTDELYAKIANLVDGNDIFFVGSKTWNDNNNRFGIGIHGKTINEVKTFYFCIAYGVIANSNGFLNPLIEADTNVHEWRYSDYTYTLENSSVDVSISTFGSETQNLRLFYGCNKVTKCRIYEYRHKKGNAEYHLIPCLDSNNTPCMYDVINDQAYYNSAESGSFTYKLYPQPTEIWSCGEYNPTDGKYHILVQPLGGSIADIALSGPLRKVNDVADTIEFPSDTEGKALVTRNIGEVDLHDISSWSKNISQNRYYGRYNNAKTPSTNTILVNILSAEYTTISFYDITNAFDDKVIAGFTNPSGSHITFRDTDITDISQIEGLILYELATPTTELVDAPQIAEADSYTCVISQGGKAVSWSSFITNSE